MSKVSSDNSLLKDLPQKAQQDQSSAILLSQQAEKRIVHEFDGKALQSIAKGEIDLSAIASDGKSAEEEAKEHAPELEAVFEEGALEEVQEEIAAEEAPEEASGEAGVSAEDTPSEEASGEEETSW